MAKKKVPTTVDVLKRMRTLIRGGWTQRVCARGKSGREVDYDGPRAVSFCIYGAEHRAVSELGINGYQAELFISECIEGSGIQRYNDAPERKKSEVLKVLTCAIEKATNTAKRVQPSPQR